MRIKRLLLAVVPILFATSVARAGVAVLNPAIAAVYVSSMDVAWQSTTTVTGYMVNASTIANFSIINSSTVVPGAAASSATLVGLNPNTSYYAEIGGASGGTTSYVTTVPASTFTLASPLINPQVYQIYSTSVTANWFAFAAGTGTNTSEGYVVEMSSTNFIGTSTIYFSSNTTPAISTLTVNGLTPSSTYYVKAGAFNGNGTPNLVPLGSIITTANGGLASPTGFMGVAASTSSIVWSWNLVTGATGYNLYLSTSPATLLVSTPILSYVDTGLSTNTAYGLFVTAVGGGIESPFSPMATAYTFAVIPGTPTFSNVTASSFTVSWSTNTNPGNTVYEVSLSTDGFATSVSTPIPFASAFTGNTTNFINLLSATTYYVRVRAQNGGAIATALSPVGSTETAVALTAPTGLMGAAASATSIVWSWNLVTGATGYNLYLASAPTILLASTPTLTYTELGLSTNTAYGVLVTALSGGMESPLSVGATVYTLADLPGAPIFSAVATNSLTVTWSSTTNPSNTPYEVSTSTDNFVTSMSTPIPFGSGFTGNTTNFTNLLSATTYYVRVRAKNGNNFPTTFSSITSTRTLGGLAAPTGLTNIAVTFNSINWSWTLVGPATGYNIYLASSPTTLIGSTTTIPWLETGLTINTAYGIVISALGPGQVSPLSASTTFYTQANLPGAPTISNIGSSSFTVTWGSGGNPGYTPYKIEVAPDNSFLNGVSTAVPFSANLTANTTNVIGLAPNTQYFVRVTAQNGNGIASAPSANVSATTKQNGTGSGAGSGLGTASLAPANVPEGGVMTTTITFTVPSVGMNAGGRLEIDAPSGWWPNPLQNTNSTQDGYVSVTSTAGVSFNLAFGNTLPMVAVSFASGFLSAGTTIQVVINNIHPNCPAPNQTSIGWEIKSAMSPADPLGDIASQPNETFVTGPFQWVGYNPWNPLTVVVNQPSQAIVLQADDNCGQPVALGAPITVNLTALKPDGTPDGGAAFSAASNFSVSTTSVLIPAASSTTVYYYQTPTIGSDQIRGDYNGGQQVWRSVNVLANPITFNNVAVDNGVPVAGQKSLTISPDGTGTNNFAYVRFTPSDSSTQWHVAISSDNFQTLVYERWGNGDPQGTVSWDGRNDSFIAGGAATNVGPQPVPNGTYTIKVEIIGLVSDTSLSVSVNSAQIAGTVKVSNVPVAGAQINAQGSNGPGYSSTVSDANGNYTLYGLHAGTQYNLYATYINPVNQSVVTGQINNAAAGSSGQNFNLTTPDVIRVFAVAPSTAPAIVFGNINIHSSDYSQNFFGNLRLVAGSSTTDNGNSFNPSTWTVFYVPPGSYVLHLTMPGYGASDVTVTNSSDVVISLTQEASVYGLLTLPAPAPYAFWASVSGSLAGSNVPTVWGGASFNVGQSSAVYNLFDVPPGTYALLSQVYGYAPSSLTNVIVGSSDLGNSTTGGGADFPIFSVGGTISGTLTINGDTSGMPGPLMLYLNAYSPQLGYNVSTQVQLSTSATQTSTSYQIGGVANGTYQMFAPYLQGFDATPSGPQNVVVSGGSGSENIVLTQETGQLAVTVKLPNNNSDYGNVYLSLQGQINQAGNLTGATTSIFHLGTGFYNLTAVYGTTGAQAQSTVNLTNGQTASVLLDLSAPTFAISGAVSVQSGFSMRGTTGTLVTVNTVTDLLANATNQNIYIGGTNAIGVAGGGGALSCGNVVPITTSTARVEAFSKSFNSFGNMNRSGFTNCFGVGQYKYGTIQADGSYSIPNLSPGLWEIDVYPYFDNGQTPDAASQQQFITVTSGNVGNVNFALSGGNSVSGTVSLPAGVTDSRLFNVQILDTQGNSIQSTTLQLGTPGLQVSSVTYQFNNLASGQYSLLIQDPGTYDSTLNLNVIKYVAAPVQFKINGADVTGVNVALGNAARIIGSLGIQTASANGSPTLTLITSANTNLLPSNFMINAQANPWIPGGSQSASFNPGGSGPAIDSNNHFTIEGLSPGTYDVVFQQNSYGISVQAAGGLNLASYTQGSVAVTAGQTVDLGVITLKPGISVSGNVVDTSGNPLSNIAVRATPSNSQNGQNSIQTTTDAHGNFTLSGLSSDLKTYDIVAAPRPGNGDSTPPAPYGQVSRLAVDITPIPAPTVNFILTPASGQIVGRIATADRGSLSYPDGNQSGFPAAAIFLHLEGSTSDDNPLGQEYATALDGSYAIGDLVPGLYDITVESLGYQPYKISGIALANGATQNLSVITLQRGAELDATLARPDGSLVNTGQIQTVVAVSPDLTSIIFGQVNKDATTGNILSLKFSGFQVSPQTYNVLLFDQQNNITTPPEGRNLVFVSSSEVITRALTFEPSPPFAFTDAKRAGSIGTAVNLTYYFSRPLRNQGNDQAPSHWFTLSGDRTQLSVLYTPAAGEQNATIAFSAHTVDIDPTTGVEFVLSKTLTLLLGQKATSESNINPALGGSLSLSSNNDPSNVSIQGNSLLNSNGSAADATVSYNFTLTATDDVNSLASVSAAPLTAQGGMRTAAIGQLMGYGSSAFVSEAYQAMGVARTDASINPLSSFYSILLPAGLSHSLNQTAYLTLSYNTTADPAQINVYYFDGTKYLLQSTGRTVDTVNHTITVGVSHFSTFVVLQNSASVVVVNGGVGSAAAIEAFNFPNPFDLQPKTKTLNRGGSTTSMSTNGTIIRYFIPGSEAVGAASIDIYDVVGEKVRTLDLGVPAGDVYNYVAWDGQNSSGHNVASGVYIGELKVGGNKAFFKMAVIK